MWIHTQPTKINADPDPQHWFKNNMTVVRAFQPYSKRESYYKS